MQSDIKKVEEMLEIKKIIAKMAFKHQDTVDLCTWGFLNKNKISADPNPIGNDKIYEILFNKEHKDRIVTHSEGIWLCFKEDGKPTAAEIAYMVFSSNSQFRKAVYEYFLKMKPGHQIGHNALAKLRKIEGELLSDNWIKSAISFCDIIKADWLYNLMGLKQAIEMKDESAIEECATNVFRPSIASAESIGIGVLQPSYARDSYVKDILRITEEISEVEDLLDEYYIKYGHIPLCYDNSIYTALEDFFVKHPCNDQEKWNKLWRWAERKNSPLSRFHVCCYFVRSSNKTPKEQLQVLFDELLNIIHIPAKDGSELQWTSAWRLRCELAKHFGQFLESRLPGANTERIYSQAWWMAEKIASLYGNNPEDIESIRKYTISPEEDMSNLVWQMSRARTVASSLRYATLMTSSLWAISIISQIDNGFIDYICKTNLQNKELFFKSVLGFTVGCFPLKSADEINCVYAYDKTCIDVAEYLSKQLEDVETKGPFIAVLPAIRNLADSGNIINQVKSINEQSEGEQLLEAVAMRVMAYTDSLEKGNEIWDVICNEEWLTSTLSTVKNEYVIDILITSLLEILLQKQNKWAWQLPHLFSIVCQNNIENERVKKFAFVCVVISSIYSDTCSALKRTLQTNKSDVIELREEWNKRLQEIYHIAPDCTRARLRPILLCLS
ncbi:hypothetical protein ACFL3G_06585 [Planctomycetota bacterium]